MQFTEILGYISSAIVVISLLMSSIVKLRWFNLVGASLTVIYGFLIKAYPIVGLNVVIVLIDAYFLIKLYTAREYFKILRIKDNDMYLNYFINYNEEEINEFYPDFKWENRDDSYVTFSVLRNMVTAGVFVCRKDGDTLCVEMDYVIPEYRDTKVGRYIFIDSKEYFESLGYKYYKIRAYNASHRAYLIKIGFKEKTDDNGNKYFRKKVI